MAKRTTSESKPGTYGEQLEKLGEQDGVDLPALWKKMTGGDKRAGEAVVA